MVLWLCTCRNKYTKPDESTISGSHFVEHCISISWKPEIWSALILDWSGLFVTWTWSSVCANLLWSKQYVDANSDDFGVVRDCCSFIFVVILSLLCHLNVGLRSCQLAVMQTVWYVHANFDNFGVVRDCCSFIFEVILSLLCHLNLGLRSCQFAVMQTVCSRKFRWLWCGAWLLCFYFCGHFVFCLILPL